MAHSSSIKASKEAIEKILEDTESMKKVAANLQDEHREFVLKLIEAGGDIAKIANVAQGSVEQGVQVEHQDGDSKPHADAAAGPEKKKQHQQQHSPNTG